MKTDFLKDHLFGCFQSLDLLKNNIFLAGNESVVFENKETAIIARFKTKGSFAIFYQRLQFGFVVIKVEEVGLSDKEIQKSNNGTFDYWKMESMLKSMAEEEILSLLKEHEGCILFPKDSGSAIVVEDDDFCDVVVVEKIWVENNLICFSAIDKEKKSFDYEFSNIDSVSDIAYLIKDIRDFLSSNS